MSLVCLENTAVKHVRRSMTDKIHRSSSLLVLSAAIVTCIGHNVMPMDKGYIFRGAFKVVKN